MNTTVPFEVRRNCVELKKKGKNVREIYNDYFSTVVDYPFGYEAFARALRRWSNSIYPDDTTLNAGTFNGFYAHGATVQVSNTGEIKQAWIKQHRDGFNEEDFLKAIKDSVQPMSYSPMNLEKSDRMLEIPLFDMHWGLADFCYYESALSSIVELIRSKRWDKIVIPFGQDFFHNDSIEHGTTSNKTPIEKVDMIQAVKDAQRFVYCMVDESIQNANSVKIIYTPGNHDRSTSWMFIQVLLERYGSEIVDDSFNYHKVVTFGNNAIMFMHGDSKRASASKNLAIMFATTFPKEFGGSTTREVHCGHLHHEVSEDIFGVMVRRCSTAKPNDKWGERNDYINSISRFMVFEWNTESLNSIYYVR